MKNKYVLRLSNVTKKIKNNILFNNLDLNITQGEIISIIGSSGIGKTTLLKCVNGLEKIDSGNIYLNGVNINSMSSYELKQKIGLVFQEYNLFNNLSVIENLVIGLEKIKKLSINDAMEKAKDMLEVLKMTNKINSYPDELSGGEQQRIAIARTLLMEPKIIMFDEPTSALDKNMKKEVLNLIKELSKLNYALIIVSHEEDFINKVSDKIYELKNKKLELVKQKHNR